MTNYQSWDSKATALVRKAEEEEKKEEAEANDALGLDGIPRGPPTVKAEEQIGELGEHSEKRKEFIDWSKKREISQTHKTQEEPIMLDTEEVKGMALRLIGSEGVTYVIPEGSGVVKLVLDKCKNVRVQVLAPIITSTIEAYRCVDVTFDLSVPMGTFQVDECVKPVTVNFAERDHVGRLYHQNSPGLSVGFDGELHVEGRAGEVQHYTRLADAAAKHPFITDFVRRGEGDFPVDMPGDATNLELLEIARKHGYTTTEGGQILREPEAEQPEPEVDPEIEQNRRKAEVKRAAGNEMFRANDFFQAAMEYTSALELDPKATALYANRSVCWLKLGNHEKALEDAKKCTDIDPTNAKGWFRQGMSLHAMKRFGEAIPALIEAEKLDPKNKQIPEAIKMAQLMARKEAAGA